MMSGESARGSSGSTAEGATADDGCKEAEDETADAGATDSAGVCA